MVIALAAEGKTCCQSVALFDPQILPSKKKQRPTTCKSYHAGKYVLSKLRYCAIDLHLLNICTPLGIAISIPLVIKTQRLL